MPRAPVLVIDDEDVVRSSLCRLLEGEGHVCMSAPDARSARSLLRRHRFGLALCDLRLPDASGLDLVREMADSHPEIVSVVVTGVDEPSVAERAHELGVFGYLVKPFTPNELLIEVASARARHRRDLEGRTERGRLEQTVEASAHALQRALQRLERSAGEWRASLGETIGSLARAAEFREEGTRGHVDRVGEYSALLAHKLGVEPRRCELVRVASFLHDVGKLAIPDRVLLKPGPLTADERTVVERHTDVGRVVLSGSTSSLLRLASTIAYTHHERFDGKGYPRGIAGEAIPLEGRIAAVADVFDALTTDRVYRPALSLSEALSSMRAERGHAFDPRVLDAFLGALVQVLAIRRRHGGSPLGGQKPSAPGRGHAELAGPAPLLGEGAKTTTGSPAG